VERVHHRDRVGELFGGGSLKAGEPVHRDNLHAITPGLRAPGEPALERLLGAALDHIQQPRRAGAAADRRQVNDHGDVLAATAGVPPHVLIDTDDLHPVEPAGVADQDPLALGQDRDVGGVPRNCQSLGNAGDAQVLADDPFQGPPQPAARQLRPRLGCPAGVLPPHMPAAGAPVADDRDQQDRRPPPQRLMCQAADHGIAGHALAAATAAPLVGLDDPAGEYRPIGLQTLAHDTQPQLVKAAELGQVRAREGTVVHVEVFRMGSVRTPILGRPRRLSPYRHASPSTPPTAKSR